MGEIPFGLALAAGMLAAVNPCGLALLPAYLSFLVLGDDSPSRRTAVVRALVLTGAMTLGFGAVFGIFGLVIAPVAGSIQQHMPWFTIGLGIVIVGLGVWLLAGRQIQGIRLRRGSSASSGRPVTRSVPSMAAFGASYALASLGCAIGPFLGIVVASFETRSVLAGVGLFLTYAAGMGLLVGLAALATSLARTSLTRSSLVDRLRRLGPALSRVAGGLLTVVGAYVAYYGWYEVRLFQGTVTGDPVVGTVEDVSGWVSAVLDQLGPGTVAAGFGVLLVAGLLAGRLVRQNRNPHAYKNPG